MACPFFTTVKMITALMILFFSFMQFMAIRKRWQAADNYVKQNDASAQDSKTCETSEQPSNANESEPQVEAAVN